MVGPTKYRFVFVEYAEELPLKVSNASAIGTPPFTPIETGCPDGQMIVPMVSMIGLSNMHSVYAIVLPRLEGLVFQWKSRKGV